MTRVPLLLLLLLPQPLSSWPLASLSMSSSLAPMMLGRLASISMMADCFVPVLETSSLSPRLHPFFYFAVPFSSVPSSSVDGRRPSSFRRYFQMIHLVPTLLAPQPSSVWLLSEFRPKGQLFLLRPS